MTGHANPIWRLPGVQESLRQLVAEGLTAGQIAERLGGVTRMAVIGKCRRLRLKLARSPQNLTRVFAERKPRMQNISPIPIPKAILAFPASKPKPARGKRPTLDVATAGMCRRILGEVSARMICGEPVVPGLSWCPDCAQKVFANYSPELIHGNRLTPP